MFSITAVLRQCQYGAGDTGHDPPRMRVRRISRSGLATRVAGPVVLLALILAALAPNHAWAKSVKYESDINVSKVVAQVPPSNAFKSAERSDEELLIMQMTLGNLVLRDAMFGFPKQGSLILPLTDFVDALEFPISVDVENGLAGGWFLSENRLFSLDLAARRVVIAGESRRVDPAFVEQLPDDIYVDVRTLAQWFPVDLEFDLPNLILNVTTREPIPIEARLKREKQREKTLNQRGPSRKKYPPLEVPYEWISWPVSDTTVNMTLNSSDDGPTISRSYTTLATADLMKLNADFFLSGTDKDQLAIARIKLGRQRPEGGLLGKLNATKFAIGDVFGPQISQIASTKLGRGFTVANTPIGRETEFDRITLQGDLQLGWEVELYRNEVLLDFRQSQSDGRYLFENVPLLFGVNVIKLVFYGPQGQVREEIQQLRVGPDQIKPGKHLYNVSLNQQERLTLIGDDDAVSTSGFQGKTRFVSQYKYGVNKNLSVGGNLVSIPYENGHRYYVGTNLVTSLGPVFGRVDISKDVTGGWASTFSAQTQLFGVSVLGEHTFLNDFLSEIYSNESDPLKTESRLRFDGVLRTGILPHVPYAFNVTHESNKSRNRSTEIQNRLSMALGRASISNTVTLTMTDPAESDDSETASGTLQLGGQIGNIRTRGQIGYQVLPENKVSSIALTGDWKLNPKFNARAGVSKQLTGSELATITGGVNTDFDLIAAGLDGSYDTGGNYSASLKLTYSWGKDAAEGGLRLASKPTAERGTMTAFVFRDYDGDGAFTQGVDEPIKDVRFRSGRRRLQQKTNAEGLAFVTSLETYEPTSFEVDEASLIDPFWIAHPKGVEVTLRPGVPGQVNFAVVSTGEVDGVVYRQRNGVSRALSDVVIQLVDEDDNIAKEVKSQFDGFFLLDFIAPGTYSLRIDPEQLERLKLPSVAARTIEIGVDGTVLNGEDFVIGGRTDGKDRFRVYLSSFKTEEQAKAAWQEIVATLPKMLKDIEPEYERVTPNEGGPEIIDLLALPFDNRDAAENVCIELRAVLGDTWCNPLTISIKQE